MCQGFLQPGGFRAIPLAVVQPHKLLVTILGCQALLAVVEKSSVSQQLCSMKQPRPGSALVAFLVALLASSCSAKQPGTFADFLASKRASTAAAAVQSESYDYGPREYVHQCLKEIAYKNCRWPTDASTEYFE